MIFLEITSLRQLKSVLRKEMRKATQETYSAVKNDSKEILQSFYSQGSPRYYKRIGHYRDSRRTTPVNSSGDVSTFEVYLDTSTPYRTGTFSTEEVFEAIQHNGYRVLGKPGTWDEVQDNIEENINIHFSSHFN